jgi:hypothetical protein
LVNQLTPPSFAKHSCGAAANAGYHLRRGRRREHFCYIYIKIDFLHGGMMKQSNFYVMGAISLFGSITHFFGILAKVNYSATFILLFFACIYFVMGFLARKNFSIIVLTFYVVSVTIQIGYLTYLENRFTPVPILLGTLMIYQVIQDYKNIIKKKEKTQQVGDL